jgi:hypothetical protein
MIAAPPIAGFTRPQQPASYDLDYLDLYYTPDTAMTRGLDGQTTTTITMNPIVPYMEPVAIAVEVRSASEPSLKRIAWFFNAQIGGCQQWEWRNYNGDTVQAATSFATSDTMDPFQRNGKAMPVNFGIYTCPGIGRDCLTFTVGNPHRKGEKIDVKVTVYAQEHATLPPFVTKDNFFVPCHPPRTPVHPPRPPAFSDRPSPAFTSKTAGEGIARAWANYRKALPSPAPRPGRPRGGCEGVSAEVNRLALPVYVRHGIAVQVWETCRTPTVREREREAHPVLPESARERSVIASWLASKRIASDARPEQLARAIANGDHLAILGSCGAWEDES